MGKERVMKLVDVRRMTEGGTWRSVSVKAKMWGGSEKMVISTALLSTVVNPVVIGNPPASTDQNMISGLGCSARWCGGSDDDTVGARFSDCV